MTHSNNIRAQLKEHGLKVTPQRKIILEIIRRMKNHPTAEMVIRKVTSREPDISPGTVYKTLNLLSAKGIITRIKTDKDVMRYDPSTARHHHLYIKNTDEIVDYKDEELNHILEEYFHKKNIPGFRIEDFRLEIIGREQG